MKPFGAYNVRLDLALVSWQGDSHVSVTFFVHCRSGSSGEEKNGIPTGEMSVQAFREWLLESHTSTGLDVGEADHVSGKRRNHTPSRVHWSMDLNHSGIQS